MIERKTFHLADVKAREDSGYFTGRASVYGVVDHHNDVVMPGAFTKTLAESGGRIKVLNQHDTYDVIGMAMLADSADALLVTEGKLELELPSAKEAYVRLKAGLIEGISIGYETLLEKFEKGVRQLTEIKLWEISIVTFPANQFARVTSVKSGETQDDATAILQQAIREVKRAESLFSEEKAGRILSATNLTLVKDCYTAGHVLCEKLGALIKVAEGTEDEDAKAKAAAQAAEYKAAVDELTAVLTGFKL